MAEYIEKETLIKELEADFNTDWADYASKNNFYKDYIDGVRDEYDDVLKIVSQQKTADVQPVSRGHWEYHKDHIMCNVCKFSFNESDFNRVTNTGYFYFCPRCGADMRGEDNG